MGSRIKRLGMVEEPKRLLLNYGARRAGCGSGMSADWRINMPSAGAGPFRLERLPEWILWAFQTKTCWLVRKRCLLRNARCGEWKYCERRSAGLKVNKPMSLDSLKKQEEQKRERAYNPALRWRHIQQTITWAEANLPAHLRRNRPRTARAPSSL